MYYINSKRELSRCCVLMRDSVLTVSAFKHLCHLSQPIMLFLMRELWERALLRSYLCAYRNSGRPLRLGFKIMNPRHTAASLKQSVHTDSQHPLHQTHKLLLDQHRSRALNTIKTSIVCFGRKKELHGVT